MAARATVRGGAQRASAGIASLPDDVLQRILGELWCFERCEGAAGVCRRWRAACWAPALLRKVNVNVFEEDNEEAFLERLRSVAQWLTVRAAPHVEDLRLHISLYDKLLSAEHHFEVTTLLSGMLAACGGPGGRLRSLDLFLKHAPFAVSSWLAPLAASLRLLRVQCIWPVWRATALPLPALEELVLVGTARSRAHGLALSADVGLPATLTKLVLTGLSGSELPPQVGSLTRLSQLFVIETRIASDGYAPLAQLAGSLRKLHLQDVKYAPSCLPQLTALRALTVLKARDGGAHVTAALPALGPSLTSLVLASTPDMPSPPDQLSRLTRLRQFGWSGDNSGFSVLPGGQWLSGIERLAAPGVLLGRSHSRGSLQQATIVADVGILTHSTTAASNSYLSTNAVEWAEQLPGLRRLELFDDEGTASFSASLTARLLKAQRLRPDAEFGTSTFHYWITKEPVAEEPGADEPGAEA